jgi:hypothetical protein
MLTIYDAMLVNLKTNNEHVSTSMPLLWFLKRRFVLSAVRFFAAFIWAQRRSKLKNETAFFFLPVFEKKRQQKAKEDGTKRQAKQLFTIIHTSICS